MTIATVEYKGHEISAYSHQIFPPHRDPYAKGPKAFSSFVRIDTIPSREIKTRRYAASSSELGPTNQGNRNLTSHVNHPQLYGADANAVSFYPQRDSDTPCLPVFETFPVNFSQPFV
jgi:hypothetical protein